MTRDDAPPNHRQRRFDRPWPRRTQWALAARKFGEPVEKLALGLVQVIQDQSFDDLARQSLQEL